MSIVKHWSGIRSSSYKRLKLYGYIAEGGEDDERDRVKAGGLSLLQTVRYSSKNVHWNKTSFGELRVKV